MSKKEEHINKLKKNIENLETGISKLNNNEHRYIFLVPDLQGQARSTNITIYEHALGLKKLGYNVLMLHEKEDYLMPNAWFNESSSDLEHISIESQKLKVSASDVLIVPEVMSNVLEQTEGAVYYRAVLVQSHDKMLTPIPPGKSYIDYGVTEVITTNHDLTKITVDLMGEINVNEVSNFIHDSFTKSDKPRKPIVAIYSSNDNTVTRIIKQFYLRFPLLKFISFKHMVGIPHENFAKNLNEVALSVWVDPQASFGRFPLESIKCGVPVIGKVPDFPKSWMSTENGVWVENEYDIPELVASYMKNWLEGTLSEFQETEKSIDGLFQYDDFIKDVETTYNGIRLRRIEMLEKFKNGFIEKITEFEKLDESEFEVDESKDNKLTKIR